MVSKLKFLKLVSSDDVTFEVSRDAVRLSITLENMIMATGLDKMEKPDPVPVSKINGNILGKVLEFCEYHAEAAKKSTNEEEIKKWDKKYMNIPKTLIHHIVLAADYLHIKILVNLCCQTLSDMIKGKPIEEIRNILNVTNDFTPEEEAKVEAEYKSKEMLEFGLYFISKRDKR